MAPASDKLKAQGLEGCARAGARRRCNICCAPKRRSGIFRSRSEIGAAVEAAAAPGAIWRTCSTWSWTPKRISTRPASRAGLVGRSSGRKRSTRRCRSWSNSRGGSRNWRSSSSRSKQTFEQRWQQEMLRREAEELKKQMEQLAQQQGQQSQSQSRNRRSSLSPNPTSRARADRNRTSQSQVGQQSSQQQAGRDASGTRATSACSSRSNSCARRPTICGRRSRRRRNSRGQQGRPAGEADARRAAERLKEAQDQLNGMRHQQASSQLGDLAERAAEAGRAAARFQQSAAPGVRRSAHGNPQRFGRQPIAAAARSKRSSWPMRKTRWRATSSQLEKDMQKAARDMAGTQPRRVGRACARPQRDAAERSQAADAVFGALYPARAGRLHGAARGSHHRDDGQGGRGSQAGRRRRSGNGDAGQRARRKPSGRSRRLERMRSQMERMAGRRRRSAAERPAGSKASRAASKRAVSNRAASSRADNSKATTTGRRTAGRRQRLRGNRARAGCGNRIRRSGNAIRPFRSGGNLRASETRAVDPQRVHAGRHARAERNAPAVQGQSRPDAPDHRRASTRFRGCRSATSARRSCRTG